MRIAMRLKTLRILRETIATGSMSKAASRLRIAQPQISRLIGDLEAEIGAPLLERHPKGVEPTGAGRILSALSHRIEGEMEDALAQIAETSGIASGEITLGVPGSLSETLVPRLLDEIRHSHPGIRLRVVDGFSAALHRQTLDGRLDLALLYTRASDRALVQEQVLEDSLGLVSKRVGTAGDSKEATVPITALVGAELVLPAAPNRLRLLVDRAAEEADVTLQVISEIDSLNALVKLCVRGTSNTILPQSAVVDEIRAGSVQWRPIVPAIKRTISLARLKGKGETQVMRAVADSVRRACHELFGSAN